MSDNYIVVIVGLVAAIITIWIGILGIKNWWVKRQRGAVDAPAATPDSPFRILVVDDRKFEHVERLKADGFDVTFRNDVERFSEIEDYQFDLILMDLHGVGLALVDDGGRGLIRHIKSASPSQVVVAYTAQQGLPESFKSLFEQADRVLNKSAPYLDFRSCIEGELAKLKSADHYIDSALGDLPAAAKKRLLPAISAALEVRDPTPPIAEVIASLPADSRLAADRALLHARTVGGRVRPAP